MMDETKDSQCLTETQRSCMSSQLTTAQLESIEKRYVCRDGINELVMDFLVCEGFKDVADVFSKEANLKAKLDVEDVEKRMQIREAVEQGDIEGAISCVNDTGSTILQESKQLYFKLRLQQFIELLKTSDTLTAIKFAQVELVPLTEELPELSEHLEQVMGLLAFPDASKLVVVIATCTKIEYIFVHPIQCCCCCFG
eukprot:m.165667 g.165667  ORF g.165667 m.165667 type:complete len:197 (-) comp13439_c0_seq3:139-729(-)